MLEEGVWIVVDEMSEILEGFMENMEEIGEQADW